MNSQIVSLVFVIGVHCKFVDGISCYTCSNVPNLIGCNQINSCSPGSICHKEYILTGSKQQYTLGCKLESECHVTTSNLSVSSNGGTIIGRSAAQNISGHCSECCNSNNCNRQLCQPEDDSCYDNSDFDCANIGSVVNFCIDAQHAKTACRRFCGLCSLTDGGWAAWSLWSTCDRTCGKSTRTRTRTCTDPAPADGGEDCVGSSVEGTHCSLEPCPIHGGWSTWTSWGECSSTCDIGLQRRDRACSNPYPGLTGDHCFGDSRDDRVCVMTGCTDGGWSNWGSWSSCSSSCGDGISTRTHQCDNPLPSITGRYCVGASDQTQQCNLGKCPAKLSAFTATKPIGDGNPLVFNKTLINVGNNYNTSTGKFTCEHAGLYYFSASLTKKSIDSEPTNRIVYEIMKNSLVISVIKIDSDNKYFEDGVYEATGSAIIHLVKGDIVSIKGYGIDANRLESWSSFSGFRINADN